MEAFTRACLVAAARRSGVPVRVEVSPTLAAALQLGETIELDGVTAKVAIREKQHVDVAAVVVRDGESLVLVAFYFALGADSEAQVLYHVLRSDGVSDDDARAAIEAVG